MVGVAVIGVLLTLIAATAWVSRPAHLTALVLERVGAALDLEITASGTGEYRLRGTPMLAVRGLVVRQPGARAPLLTADRAYLALPWATLWSGGDDLTIRRVELDRPQINLPALQDWLATRPKGGPLRIPTLTSGMRIVEGELVADGWLINRLNASTERLQPGKPLAARVRGRIRSAAATVPFDLQLALTQPAQGAGVGVAGIATVISDPWRMPLRLQVSGVLRDDDDGIGLDVARLGAHVRWFSDSSVDKPTLDFAIGLAGRLRHRDGTLRIAPVALALRGRDALPEKMDATGTVFLDEALALHLDGELAEWPSAWPALPVPLGDSDAPLPFTLDYVGAADLSGQTRLHLQRDDVRFDGRFRIPDIAPWLAQLATGTPLPPLQGTLEVPRIELGGATLTGVRVELDDAGAQGMPGADAPAPDQ